MRNKNLAVGLTLGGVALLAGAYPLAYKAWFERRFENLTHMDKPLKSAINSSGVGPALAGCKDIGADPDWKSGSWQGRTTQRESTLALQAQREQEREEAQKE
jgi:hypothetical protein